MLIEERLDGMANRQEEFLQLLEATLRRDLFGLSRDEEKLKHPKVWRENNSIFVKAFSTRAMQAKITVEKSNSDLSILSDGYKHTLLGKIFVSICLGFFVLLVPLLIIFLAISPLAGQTHPPEWDKIILYSLGGEAFMVSVAWFMWTQLIRRASDEQNQGLAVVTQKTINLFEGTTILTEEEYPTGVIDIRKRRILLTYRTCTFKGLGSRRNEFLEKFTQLMKARGFVENPFPVIGDIQLESPKEGLVTLRVKDHNDNLKVGHIYNLKLDFRLKSPKGFGFLIFNTLLILGVVTATFKFGLVGTSSLWGGLLLWFIWASPVFFPIFIYVIILGRTQGRKMDQYILETAESLGGKQITPFKTTKMEDFI